MAENEWKFGNLLIQIGHNLVKYKSFELNIKYAIQY